MWHGQFNLQSLSSSLSIRLSVCVLLLLSQFSLKMTRRKAIPERARKKATFTVNPLYHQTSAQFDEGVAKGLLSKFFGIYGDCHVLFDSFEIPEKSVPEATRHDGTKSIDICFAKAWDDDDGFSGTSYDEKAFSDVGKSSTLVSQPRQLLSLVLKSQCLSLWLAMLLGFFENVIGCVSDPSKVVHTIFEGSDKGAAIVLESPSNLGGYPSTLECGPGARSRPAALPKPIIISVPRPPLLERLGFKTPLRKSMD
ncbi:hypothetical protein FXO37_25651 [Capsicum annuum]|nr:hypothetical protein FXO37_25651 [Capsicum annuum]